MLFRSVDAKSEAFRAGADDYLVKPIVPEELVARAVRALERNYGVRPTVRRAEPPAAVECTPAPVASIDTQPEAAALAPASAPAPVEALAQGDFGDEQASQVVLAVETAAPEPTPPAAPEPLPVMTTNVLPPAVPPILGPSANESRPPAFLAARPPLPPPEDRAVAATTRQNAWGKFLGRSRPQ